MNGTESDTTQVRLTKGRELHVAGELEQACAIYDQVLRDAPAHPEALHLRGVISLQRGDVDDAILRLEAAVAAAPDHARAHNNLGVALKACGRLEASAAAFAAAHALDPEAVDIVFNQGTAYDAMGRPADALAAYDAALRIAPEMVDAHMNRGLALHSLGRLDEALAGLERAMALRPTWEMPCFNAAKILREQGDLHRAFEMAQRGVELNSRHAEGWVGLGQCLEALERFPEARDAHARAIQVDPDLAQAYLNLATMCLRTDEPKAADQAVGRYLDQVPGSTLGLAVLVCTAAELGDRTRSRRLLDFERLLHVQHVEHAPGFDSLDQFNEALCTHILAHDSLVANPPNHATRIGRHSGNLLVEPKGPVAALEHLLYEAISGYLERLTSLRDELGSHPFLDDLPSELGLSIWGVVLGAEGHQIAHIHPSSWLSGVYYAKVPQAVDPESPDRAGWIEFGCANPDFPLHHEPEVHSIAPAEGTLVLFPSYFLHRTIPFHSDETRVSIAFDASRPRDLESPGGRTREISSHTSSA